MDQKRGRCVRSISSLSPFGSLTCLWTASLVSTSTGLWNYDPPCYAGSLAARDARDVRRAFSNFSPSLAWVYSKMHCTSQLLYHLILQIIEFPFGLRIYLSTWFGVDALIISIDISRFIAEAASFGIIQCPTMSHAPVIRSTITLRFGDTMSSSLSSGRYLCLGFGMVGFS